MELSINTGNGVANTQRQNFDDASSIKALGMKEWIISATTYSDDQNQFKLVSSPNYLLGATKIAYSLADQLSVIEEQRGYDDLWGCEDNEHRIIKEPHHGIHQSWSSCVSVLCADNTNNQTDINYGGEMHASADDRVGEHSNVQGAMFIEDHDDDIKGTSLNDMNTIEMMHCLGGTFVELFSGGQVIIAADEEKLQQQQQQMATQSFSLHQNTGDINSELSITTQSFGGMSASSKRQTLEYNNNGGINDYILQLRSLGLPNALCDVIGSMIGNTTEESHDNEAYQCVTDVRDDLKMMIESPKKYLFDLDTNNASIQWETNIDGRSILFGRESELEALKESFHRSISSECEVVQINGPSGIGKSSLCAEFAAYATRREDDCMFLSGRFDRLQQSRPFHVIGSAFDKYCTWLRAKDQPTIEKVSATLRKDIGDEIWRLASVMPNLSSILGGEKGSKKGDGSDSDNDAVDAQKRMRYLFCQFVKTISKCHNEAHMIICLDDSQWVDAASVALLHQILMMSGSVIRDHRFFFVVCCRDDEMNDTHPLTTMLSLVNTFGIKLTKIHLTPMTKDTVNELVSTTLSLLPRVTRPLANILHHRTKGNPIFVKQLMAEMCRRGYLSPSLTRRRWVWETGKICDMKIPESIASFILSSFNRLSPEVLSALCCLSCFGASANVDFIEELEAELKEDLINYLDIAVTESILDKRNNAYYFVHDKLQEAAYSVMDPDQRCKKHVLYGLALARASFRESDDELLIVASTQINLGGPAYVDNREQAVEIAKLNLDAGKVAMKMSDFFLAYSFFDYGISYLHKGHWERNYDLSLALFNLLATCADMNGEFGNLPIILQQIMHYARCIEDKLNAFTIAIKLKMWSGQVAEAIKMASNTLKNLGEDIPGLITPALVAEQLNGTKEKLAEISDDAFLVYPMMVDPLKIAAINVLHIMFTAFGLVACRASQPYVVSKMIELSLESGFSNFSPVAFAYWSNYLALVENDFEGGCRYAKLALSLMRSSSSRAHDGTIIFFTAHTKMHIEPLQSAREFYLEGHRAAMTSGATMIAISCAMYYDITCFWVGKKVNEVCIALRETITQAKFYNNTILLTMMLPVYKVALKIGKGVEQNDTIEASEENVNKRNLAAKLPSHILMNSFHGFYDALMFRELERANDYAKTFYEVQSDSTSSMAGPMYMRDFYFGLVAFWLGRELNDKKWVSRGTESKFVLVNLATKASTWSFENKAILLQAEEQFSERNFDEAELLYDAAISSSKQHKFLNEEALANELAGYFYLDTGRKKKSVHYFSQAFQKYNEWGAEYKATTLVKYLDESRPSSS